MPCHYCTVLNCIEHYRTAPDSIEQYCAVPHRIEVYSIGQISRVFSELSTEYGTEFYSLERYRTEPIIWADA